MYHHTFYHSESLESKIEDGIVHYDISINDPIMTDSGWTRVYLEIIKPAMIDAGASVRSCNCPDCVAYAISRMRESVGDLLVTKAGKIGKRISKHLYQTDGVRLTDSEVSSIGNIAYENSVTSVSAYADITDDFHWDDGMFGHEGSCYWGCYAESRDMIQDAHGLALRYYGGYDDRDGIGRTWIIPVSNNSVVIFNAYGRRIQESAIILSSIMREQTGDEYSWHKVYLTNDGAEAENSPYINGKTGIVIYPIEDPYPDDEVHLNIEYRKGEFYLSVHGITCECCEQTFDRDSMYEYGDNYYCEDCYHELFTRCAVCGDSLAYDDAYTVGDEYVCEYCHSYRVVTCDGCGEDLFRSQSYTLDGNRYCESCFNEEIQRQAESELSEIP